ncbi:MAG TPA: ABC transporter transmembrane domain-containing protein [Alphaproteobacteria bacterium]|nr:ABC transporter transmembrane domain-containing protein [Alphaproteobacteria bacterium]
MDKTIQRFVLRYSTKETAILCALTISALPFYYLSLDVPKNIFNQAILGKDITYPTEFFGVELGQIGYLFLLCTWFFILVVVNGGIKQFINNYKGRLGERLLRRMRYELISRIMRFPLPHFRKVSSGELIPMVTAEVEPLGGFMGDAFAQPLIQAGTLLTIVTFLFVQNPIMGFAAISLYPIQGYLIPKLQRKVNLLGKERVRAMRKVSERIGESVAGIHEIRAHGAVPYERADFSDRLGLVYRIRYEIFRRKSLVKFLNNFLNQMAPLLFYSIGGYLVITGDLTAGALAAALTAHKDMSSPWKELLDYYQQYQDSKIKYDQVTEQFRPENMIDPDLQVPIDQAPPPLSGPISVANLTLVEDASTKLLDGVTFAIAPGEKVALCGPPGGGKEGAALALPRLLFPSAGRISIGGKDLATLGEPMLGARIGYVGPSAYLFAGAVRDNVAYGLKQRPIRPVQRDEASERQHRRWLAETMRAGNLPLDPAADWIDYAAAGCADGAEFAQRMIEVLAAVDMEEDIYQLGLRGTIDPKQRPAIAESVLEARTALHERLAAASTDPAMRTLVESFHPDRYNDNATVAENLLFGTPVDEAFDIERLAVNPYVLAVLDRLNLTGDLLAVGREVAETMIELFADLPPGHEFFEQFSFISADDLPEFRTLLARTAPGGEGGTPEDRARLLGLPFRLIAARHRLDVLDEPLKMRIVEARKALRESLPAEARTGIAFFDPSAYNAATTLQDNILFGKIAYGQARAGARVGRLIAEVLEALDLRRAVIEVGLDFQVGVAGSRLSAAQRQKIGVARALIKQPDVMVVNEATTTLDSQSQMRVMEGIFRECTGRVVIWTLHNPALARHFDRVLVFADGRLVEHGGFGELERSGSLFAELIAAA